MTVAIIETNITLLKKGTPDNYFLDIGDHQSRVIEFSSWEDYINVYKEAKYTDAKPLLNSMTGAIIPLNAEVSDLNYDHYHMNCVINEERGWSTKCLAYLIR